MKANRMKIIEKMLFEKEKVTTEELSSMFDVSEVTIRSDLSRIAKKNKEIKRIYGGAALVHKLEDKANKIVRKAFEEIEDNDVIFLGSGSTCCYLAELLKEKPEVSVVTNNISALFQLIQNKNKVYFIGGEVSTVDGNTYFSSIQDPLQYIQSIYVNKVFTSCRGIDEEAGVTVNSIVSTYIYEVIPKIHGKWYMMMNGDKFGKIGMYRVAEVDKLGCIITDHIDDEFKKTLIEKNIELQLV